MATCIYCHRKLPSNDVVEAFPFARRVAYDSRRLRFWVVCRCGKWSLAPIEPDERAAAIDHFERWWRTSSTRYSSGGIGLGEYSPRLSLVRVGESNWNEFASWRYAKALVRRRQRYWFGAGASCLAAGLAVGMNLISIPVALVTVLALPASDNFLWRTRKPVCRVPAPDGTRQLLRQKHIAMMELQRGSSGWLLHVRHEKGVAELHGGEAIRVLGYSLPVLNYKGAWPRHCGNALDLIRDAGGPEGLTARIAEPVLDGAHNYRDGAWLMKYASVTSYALEIAAQEQNERRLLENELALLRTEWREAEEIASISASLLPDVSRLSSRA